MNVWNGNHRVAMLLCNEIAGVVPIKIEEKQGERCLRYDTEGGVSLEEWCRMRELGERDLRWILNGILQSLKEGEAFLLTPNYYVLQIEHIFLQPSKEQVRLCVRPEGEREWTREMLELGRFFLEAIDYKDEECVKLAYEFYHVSKQEGLRLEDYQDLLKARVYTVITDDDEMSERIVQETAPMREDGGWIQIAAGKAEAFLPERRETFRKEALRKRILQGILTGAAVALVLFALHQSGF